MDTQVVEIEHFSDVLCIWAYIAQKRIEELESNFPGQVRFEYRFLQVFGDVSGKMSAVLKVMPRMSRK